MRLTKSKSQEEREKRKRKIIWFHEPLSTSFKTNIGKLFFELLGKHFP